MKAQEIKDDFKSELVHISQIKKGDTIEHYGLMQTVCSRNISRSELMGICLFGCSYKANTQKVKRFLTNKAGCLIPNK